MQLEDYKRNNPYKTPEGYFENFQNPIEVKNKTINVSRRWAAAASLAICMVAYFWFVHLKTPANCVSLSCIDKELLIKAAEQYDLEFIINESNADSISTGLEKINNEELETYLNNL